jgi:transposase, IS5 family
LNEGREKLEWIIDILHEPFIGSEKKVRTYRRRARKDYLTVAKQRKPRKREILRAIRKQLGYIRRDLEYIKGLSKKTPLTVLSKKQYRDLLVISELYRQQLIMYEHRIHSVDGRIVSISQPHVRPIVRGKARTAVEFGAKITISVVDGFVSIERLSWEPYNEGTDLVRQIEQYKADYGCYPESVHVDTIFRNRENRLYCKERNIRMSGKPLGRPPKDYAKRKNQYRKDELLRIPVEGRIGNGKRKYGWDCIMTKKKSTSETTIGLIALVLNL